MTAAVALQWMERLVAGSVALQTLELLRVRRAFRDDGVWRWSTLRREHARAFWLTRTLLDALLDYRSFVALLCVQLVAVLTLPWLEAPAPALIAASTALLVCTRFRGAYNGGSDAMTLVVLLAVAVARLAGDERVTRISLAYVSAQLVLSYFVAGVAKLASPHWRSGRALARLVARPPYAAPAGVRAWVERPALGRLTAWSVLAFECLFPAALVHPRACQGLLVLGVCFHLANARWLGLSRFLWAWVAGYPALLFWSQG